MGCGRGQLQRMKTGRGASYKGWSMGGGFTTDNNMWDGRDGRTEGWKDGKD
jgi:hypothetical protein